jgi:hypothetical protein
LLQIINKTFSAAGVRAGVLPCAGAFIRDAPPAGQLVTYEEMDAGESANKKQYMINFTSKKTATLTAGRSGTGPRYVPQLLRFPGFLDNLVPQMEE